MINHINISNFKALQQISCPLGSLNLFAGLNGMGKSTFLQVLLLLKQSFDRSPILGNGILLNGGLLSLGQGKDVLGDYASDEIITFHIIWDDHMELYLKCHADADSDILVYQSNESVEKGVERFADSSLFYIPSERIIPQSLYPASSFQIGRCDALGIHGEYTAHYIAEHALDGLRIPALRHPKESNQAFLMNLDAWMGEIAPNIRIYASYNRMNDSASLGYKFSLGQTVSDIYKPQNVGFGITHVLPVVTALLKSKKGELLLIENPEAYLHPAGQSALGRLCALAAANGVQLLIETHSDHFINGVRVAVKQKLIPANEARIYYAEPLSESVSHQRHLQPIHIDEHGRLDNLPHGFCDEWDHMLDKLLGYDEL